MLGKDLVGLWMVGKKVAAFSGEYGKVCSGTIQKMAEVVAGCVLPNPAKIQYPGTSIWLHLGYICSINRPIQPFPIFERF